MPRPLYRSPVATPLADLESTPDELADLAADNGDEHVIKFIEVAVESHRRGNSAASTAGVLAASHIT